MKDLGYPYWDCSSRRYIYNLVQAHATMHGVSTIAIPKVGYGLDQMNWQDVVKLKRNIFAYSDIQIVFYSLDEHANHAMSAEGDPKFYAKNEIDRYSEEFHLNERELETGFTSDAKSYQPVRDEKYPVTRPKEQNQAFIEHYLLYQPKELIEYVKQFDFRNSDITDNEMSLLIDMLIDSMDV